MNSDRGSNWNRNRGNRGGFRGGRGRRPFWRDQRSNGQGSLGGFRGGNRGQSNFRNQNNQWKNRPKRDFPTKRLTEESIGVTEYISDHEGFLGIIKSRYSDFQVSEINESGEVAKLTTTAVPAPPADNQVVEDEDLLLSKYNLELLPMETWDSINTLAINTEKADEKVEVDVTGMTKEQRTKIHDAVKKAFGDSIVGSTVSKDDKKFVQFVKYRKGVRIDNRVKWAWPAEYVYFIVHKENCDTMDAASRIAERLRLNIKPSMLGYAGTKDRRAKTSQWFSLRKVDPRKVAAACRDLRDVRVGNFDFKKEILRLGMLRGNQFRIALRNVTAPDDSVETACQYLKVKGFINYYGLQRFGSRVEMPTYQIGLRLLQGNFKEAIAGILEEREGPIQSVLRAYAASGAAAAVRAWPRGAPGRHSIELRLLKALSANPNDLLGALNKLARNTRLLYLHSYQSLVWNRAVSERIRRSGLTPCVGDLVPLDTTIEEEIVEAEEIDDDENETDSESTTSEKPQNGDDDKMTDSDKPPAQNPLETSIKQVKQKVPVKVLTQDDVDSGKYTMADVILPLPGNMVEYPPNMKEYYEELLAKDGLDLEMKHKFKSYTMSGAYRHVTVRPLDVSWRCVRYSDPYTDLILSDADLLDGRELNGVLEDGKYKALLLTMTLPASCYATMALRELLKVDTSCDNQALQNNYHKKKVEGEGQTAERGKDDKADEGEGSDNTEQNKKEMDIKTEENQPGKRRLEEGEEIKGEEEVEVKKLKQEV